jgi:hypothetical protein
MAVKIWSEGILQRAAEQSRSAAKAVALRIILNIDGCGVAASPALPSSPRVRRFCLPTSLLTICAIPLVDRLVHTGRARERERASEAEDLARHQCNDKRRRCEWCVCMCMCMCVVFVFGIEHLCSYVMHTHAHTLSLTHAHMAHACATRTRR